MSEPELYVQRGVLRERVGLQLPDLRRRLILIYSWRHGVLTVPSWLVQRRWGWLLQQLHSWLVLCRWRHVLAVPSWYV